MKQLDYNYIPKKSCLIVRLIKHHQLKKLGIIRKNNKKEAAYEA